MDWILTLFHFIVCAFIISKWRFFRVPGISVQLWLCIFMLKILCGIGLWAIFKFYYNNSTTSDALIFFEDARVIYSSLPQHPKHFFQLIFGIGLDQPELQGYINEMMRWNKPFDDVLINDNRTIIRFNTLCMLVSFGVYHVHTVYINFLSMIGLVALYKALKDQIAINRYLLVGIVFLLPSLLFWGSGVLKEPLVMFGLGLFYYYFSQLILNKWSFKTIVLVAVLAFFLTYVKSYVLICFIPGLLYLLLTTFFTRKILLTFLVWNLGLLCIVLFSKELFNYDLIYNLTKKQIDFYNVARDWNAGSTIDIASIDTKWSIIVNAPQALINCYFRPFIHEISGILYTLSAAENMFYLLLILLTLFFFKKPEKASWRFILAWVSTVVCAGVLIGLTTPVLGAIVRYKSPILPFFALVILAFLDFEKIKNKFVGFFN